MRSRYGTKTGRSKRNTKKRSYKRKSYASTYNRFKRRMGYNRHEFPSFGNGLPTLKVDRTNFYANFTSSRPSEWIPVGPDTFMVPVDEEPIEKYSGQKRPNPGYGVTSPQQRHRLDYN